jgi:hypothetical protein
MKDEELEELIAARLAQARVALEDAKFLLDARRSPQSVINRSYYAMFYAALALLQKIGKAPSKHAGVISLFDTEFVIKGTFSKEFSTPGVRLQSDGCLQPGKGPRHFPAGRKIRGLVTQYLQSKATADWIGCYSTVGTALPPSRFSGSAGLPR